MKQLNTVPNGSEGALLLVVVVVVVGVDAAAANESRSTGTHTQINMYMLPSKAVLDTTIFWMPASVRISRTAAVTLPPRVVPGAATTAVAVAVAVAVLVAVGGGDALGMLLALTLGWSWALSPSAVACGFTPSSPP